MTTEQRLPVAPQVAIADMKWYTENRPVTEEQRGEVLRAAQALAMVVERAAALMPSRIGASAYLERNPEVDHPSFYAGVAFALSKVNKTLGGWEDGE